MTDTPGTSTLNAEQRAQMLERFGFSYRVVADGSYGGHTPGRRYGKGKLAPSLKKRGR